MELRRLGICHECLSAIRSRSAPERRSSATIAVLQSTRRSFGYGLAAAIETRRLRTGRLGLSRQQSDSRTASYPSASKRSLSNPAPASTGQQAKDLNAIHNRIQELSSSVLKPSDGPVPVEQRVLYVLEQLNAIAEDLVDARSIAGAAAANASAREQSATSALLGSVNLRRQSQTVTKAALLNLISLKAEEIVRHPTVFITAAVLKAYVDIQTLLHQPSSFPDVFELYASKPIPKVNGDGGVSFSQPSPNSLNTAIDPKTANKALTAAITARNLSLSLSIITSSFAKASFARAKILRQGAVPGAGLAIAPLVAYSLSLQFSAWQSMLDPAQATTMAFAGIMTYLGAVGTVGYVAITTSNDQMDRVTWAQGLPLWERWVREEERAALDRVAGAWGFKNRERRGDEEGEDWEALREWVGRRGMVLDRVELMDGME